MKIVSLFEKIIFKSRWILAPFFLGLLFAIVILLFKFSKQLFLLTTNFTDFSNSDLVISVLTLLDTTLIACLILIIISSGYENFISKIDFGVSQERPSWIGKVSFSDLKLKLVTAIVAISSVELLRAIINIEKITFDVLQWKIWVHLTFILTGVLFSLTEFIISKKVRTTDFP